MTDKEQLLGLLAKAKAFVHQDEVYVKRFEGDRYLGTVYPKEGDDIPAGQNGSVLTVYSGIEDVYSGHEIEFWFDADGNFIHIFAGP